MNQKQITKKTILAIIAAGIMSFCGVVVETAMNVTFPTLMQQFNIDTATVQWMTTIYLLTVATIVPLSAILKKSFSMRHLFLTANLAFLLGAVLDTVAPSFSLLLLGRVIQGIGTGIALPLMFNIILEQVPRSKIGMMMGVGSLITAIAPAIGPTFGGLVATYLNWRYIFIFLLPILILSLLLGLGSINHTTPSNKNKIDLPSFLFILLMFTGLILGFSHMGDHLFLSFSVTFPLLLGCLGIIGFVWRSNRIDTPIIHLAIFKNTIFSIHAIAFFIFQLIALGLSFILPNYIQITGNATATVAGLTVLPGALIGAVFAPFGGRILDHIGARKPIISGAILSIVALFLFSCFALHLTNMMIGVIYILFMLAIGISFGNIMTNGLKNLTTSQQADGNALLTTLQQFSGAMGTAIVSTVIAHSQANPSISLALSTAQGAQHAFSLLLFLAVIALLLLLKAVHD